jgi:cell shape-determining protein MreC
LAGLFVESIKELTKENKQLKEQLSLLQQRLVTVESKLA